MFLKKYQAIVTVPLVVEAESEEEAYLKIERMEEKIGSYLGVKIKLEDITPARKYSHGDDKILSTKVLRR